MTTQVNNRTSRQYDNQVQENQQTGRSTASPNAAGSQSQWRPIDPPRNAPTPVMRDTSNPSSMERGDTQKNQSEPSASGTAPRGRGEAGGISARNAGSAPRERGISTPSRGESPAIYFGDGGTQRSQGGAAPVERSVTRLASGSPTSPRPDSGADRRGMSAQPAEMRTPRASQDSGPPQSYLHTPYTSARDENRHIHYTQTGQTTRSYSSTPEDQKGFSFRNQGFTQAQEGMIRSDIGRDIHRADTAWNTIKKGSDENFTAAFGSTGRDGFSEAQRTMGNIDYGLHNEHFTVKPYNGPGHDSDSSFAGQDHTIFLTPRYFDSASNPDEHDGQILRTVSNMPDIGGTDKITSNRHDSEVMAQNRPDLTVHNGDSYRIYANSAETSAEQQAQQAQQTQQTQQTQPADGRRIENDHGTFTAEGFTQDQVTTLTNDFNRDKHFADSAAQRVQQRPDSLYTTFFGAESKENVDTVRDNVKKIDDSLNNDHFTFKPSSDYLDQHPEHVPDPNTSAFTDRTNHTIYFTPHYFDPNAAKWSHYGTIIHEVSHLNEVAATQDLAYGGTKSGVLARNDPNGAVQNADSYRLYMIGGEHTSYLGFD